MGLNAIAYLYFKIWEHFYNAESFLKNFNVTAVIFGIFGYLWEKLLTRTALEICTVVIKMFL